MYYHVENLRIVAQGNDTIIDITIIISAKTAQHGLFYLFTLYLTLKVHNRIPSNLIKKKNSIPGLVNAIFMA